MGSNGAKHEILPYKAGMAPVPKDGPDRVHTHALVRETIELSKKKYTGRCGTCSTLTYIKLSNGNGDRQKPCGPSFCGQSQQGTPVDISPLCSEYGGDSLSLIHI